MDNPQIYFAGVPTDLGRREGLHAKTLRALRLAALVHDVGEAKIPGWKSVGDVAAD